MNEQAECRKEAFDQWFSGTNPASLDFSHPSTLKEFTYQAWKDACIWNAREKDAEDARRMDWLEQNRVEVRTPLRYGSRFSFICAPLNDEVEQIPSDIRERIDAAMNQRTEGEGDVKDGNDNAYFG